MKLYLFQLCQDRGACKKVVQLQKAGKCAIPSETGTALEHRGVRWRLGPLMPGERPSISARVWEFHLSPVLSALIGLL